MAEENEQPIIIVKKKVSHNGHHGGAWKVAYADFVTAMMALFIVLWLLSSDDKVKKAVGGYFQDPTGSGRLMGSDLAGSGESLQVKEDDMADLKDKIEAALKVLPEFERVHKNILITVTGEGLRIELLEDENGMFFESGSAKPLHRGEELLAMLAAELGKLPNTLFVEGHTDAKPFASETGYSNWELSADRANAARRLMQDHGVRSDQIGQIRGFADQRLRDPKNPLSPSNRRVSVIVRYLHPPKDAQTADALMEPKGDAPSPEGKSHESAPH